MSALPVPVKPNLGLPSDYSSCPTYAYLTLPKPVITPDTTVGSKIGTRGAQNHREALLAGGSGAKLYEERPSRSYILDVALDASWIGSEDRPSNSRDANVARGNVIVCGDR